MTMKKHRTNHILYRVYIVAALVFILPIVKSCVDEYNPKGIDNVRDIPVIDGFITNDIAVILISKSIGITENASSVEKVTDAVVYIECDNGSSFQNVTQTSSGRYEIVTGALDPSLKYRLYISFDGDEYISEFLSPLYTPEIDSVSLSKSGVGAPIYTCVSTHDANDKPHFYRWTYEENWEAHASLLANAMLDANGKITAFDEYDPLQNIFHCWNKDNSKVILVGSSERLAENLILENRLVEAQPSHAKHSVLYHIAVTQNQIRKEAYTYYSNLQNSIEQSGGLFSPMPTDTRGNITCIKDPDRYIIGYVEVSTTTYKERFFPVSKKYYEPSNDGCSGMVEDGGRMTIKNPLPGYTVFYYNADIKEIVSWAPLRCVDCRYGKGTKERPSFWPVN